MNKKANQEKNDNNSRREFLLGLTSGFFLLSTYPIIARASDSAIASAEKLVIEFPHRKEISPDMKLSEAAVSENLSKSQWLGKLRDFLTRQGIWANHPINSIEVIAVSPSPGVVGLEPDHDNWKTSLGVGNFTMKGGAISFDTSVCASFMFSASSCDSQSCNNQTCGTDFTCGDHGCTGYECSGKHSCGTHDNSIAMLSELEQFWNSAFVQDLRSYFNVADEKSLLKAVSYYVNMNMYDVSAID